MLQIVERHVALPLEDAGTTKASPPHIQAPRRTWFKSLALCGVSLGLGMIAGVYFQSLATPVSETGGAAIDKAPGDQSGAQSRADVKVLDVVALGRLVPNGGILSVALPNGAGDARIAQLFVDEGEQVATGQVIAELDNMPALRASRASAEANVKAQQASLEQVRSAMIANLAEARAQQAAANATLTLANQEAERQLRLADSKSTTEVLVEQARADAAKARAELERTESLVDRYSGAETGDQPDILLAARNLDLARDNLNRANADLASGQVVSPQAGKVLEIHARVGERPMVEGVMTIGDVEWMTAELEVYQTEVNKVELGQTALVTGPALPKPLTGMVTRIGQIVGRQSVMSTEPAANVDARVVKVIVTLDAQSSAIAGAYTNLEVIGRIRTQAP